MADASGHINHVEKVVNKMNLIMSNGTPYLFARRKAGRYFKTIPAQTRSFTQPTLTENGIIGGDSFAVAGDSVYRDFQPWYAFRNKYVATEYFHTGKGQPHWLRFYSPNPLKVSSIKIQNRGIDGSCLANYEIQASGNGEEWVTITTGTMPNTELGAENSVSVPSSTYYKYWQIKSLSCTGDNNDYWATSRVTINALELLSPEHEIEVEEGEDYDRFSAEPWIQTLGEMRQND